MPIPDIDSIHLPILELLADRKEHGIRQVDDYLSRKFKLSEKERQQITPIGKRRTFDVRIRWAVSQLRHSGLLENSERGVFHITKKGIDALALHPKTIDRKFLMQYAGFIDYLGLTESKRNGGVQEITETVITKAPIEIVEDNYLRIRRELAGEILEQTKRCSPSFFEELVVGLLVKMGYGGSEKDAGKAIGGSGDEGIDGIIKEDALGLGMIYVQAKRWKETVGSRPIRDFIGALNLKQARKGIFITTGTFSKDAEEAISQANSGIVFIDGERLAELMIDYNIGVSLEKTYEIKHIDQEYFAENIL